MHRRTTVLFVATSALTGALVLGSSVEGCQSGGGGGTGGTGTGGTSTTSSAAATGVGGTSTTASAASTTGTGGTSTTSNGSSTTGAGGTSTASSGSSTTGTGAGDGGTGTIGQITMPGVAAGEVVQLVGVVATSSKFLVSKSASGACEWGVFLSAPGLATAAPHSAILAVAYGTPASAPDGGPAFCPVLQENQPAGDAFPDDTKPGDVLDVTGLTGSYLPSLCTTPDAGPPDVSTVAQYQLGNVSAVVRTGTNGQVPAPHVLSVAEAASLAAGADASFLDAWGGARVEVQGVTAELQQGFPLDPTGHLLLSDGLWVGDKLYYVGTVKGTDACYGSPTFTPQTPTFSSISGFVYLDFCTWDLQPRDKCHDLSPPSADCASVADAGAICTH